MSKDSGSMRAHFEKELQETSQCSVLSREECRKKLIIYVIRTSIAAVLYILLWKYHWVRMSLWLYIPLNLMGLLSITLMPMILQRKVEKTRALIDNFSSEEAEEEE